MGNTHPATTTALPLGGPDADPLGVDVVLVGVGLEENILFHDEFRLAGGLVRRERLPNANRS